jgi:hypothetical protein
MEGHEHQLLSRGGIQFREADGQLTFHLPPRPRRMMTRFGGLALVMVGFLLLVVYVSQGWWFAAGGMGLVVVIILSIAFASLAELYLTGTSAIITTDRVTLTTVLYGKKMLREYALIPQSQAVQWYSRQRPGKHSSPQPQGIEITSEPDDPETGSAWKSDTKPRFGAGLSRGEMDWLVWRINHFLDQPGNGYASEESSQKAAPSSMDRPSNGDVPRPKGTRIRIEKNSGESCILFPNTVETKSFSGVGNVLFGLGLSAYAIFLMVRWSNPKHGGGSDLGPWLNLLRFMCGMFSLLGMTVILKGLTQLFGRKRLIITPAKITYRAGLLGLNLRQTVRTAEILSVGLPQGARQRGSKRLFAPANGCVIRTAERELRYGAAVPKSDAQWVIAEVTRLLETARFSIVMTANRD